MALQGMTKEEQEIAEQCIQKFDPESVRRPQISRNAYGMALNEPLHDVEQEFDSQLLFEDVHNYESIQCWVVPWSLSPG